ncbi:hypothetical protein QBC45DRAFT_16978 [Copromyces sp. CBS 386.78]|nr:hypothetical protein QBC45DRAFT_16978 [Copromyces sp. CBS 386.78]
MMEAIVHVLFLLAPMHAWVSLWQRRTRNSRMAIGARGNRTASPLLIGETASQYQLAATALTWAVVGIDRVLGNASVTATPFLGSVGHHPTMKA